MRLVSTADLETRIERQLRAAGFVAGPVLAFVVYAWNPGAHPSDARLLLGIVTLVITWWMTEAIPLPATALVGSALAIVAGVAPVKEVLAPYANPVIFLFLGSFLLAEGFRKYGLDRRVARFLLGLRAFSGPRGLMAGLGVVSAGLSSALSNTATAALLAPIGVGALDARGPAADGRPRRFDSAILLVIAYGASIGGIATVIGTPPNLLAAGFLEELVGVQVTFTGWVLFASPIAVAMLLVALLVLRLTLARRLEGGEVASGGALVPRRDEGSVSEERERRAGARWTVAAVVLALVLWTAPAVARGVLGRSHALAEAIRLHLPEAGVALLCAALLFAAPVRWRGGRKYALTWAEGQRVNWGILLLFGGGLSLGTLAQKTGLVTWAGEGVVSSGLASSPGGLMLVAIIAATTLSEFASNTASATLLIPIVIASAVQAGFDPVAPALAAALACSCAFVFPVSTPPNAIVFGTGRLPLTRMMRTGIFLDVATVVVIWTGMQVVAPLLPR